MACLRAGVNKGLTGYPVIRFRKLRKHTVQFFFGIVARFIVFNKKIGHELGQPKTVLHILLQSALSLAVSREGGSVDCAEHGDIPIDLHLMFGRRRQRTHRGDVYV